MINFNCSKCGISVPMLQRLPGGAAVCGGCYAAIMAQLPGTAPGDAERILRLEERLKETVDDLAVCRNHNEDLANKLSRVQDILRGVRAEKEMLEEELAKCRSTGTGAAPADTQ